MRHCLRYIHGLFISILVLPLVILSLVLWLAAFICIFPAYGLAVAVSFVYGCPIVPKVKKGENLKNPIAKFSEWVCDLSFSKR